MSQTAVRSAVSLSWWLIALAVHAADPDAVRAPYWEVGDCWTYHAEGLYYHGWIHDYEECVTFVDVAKNVVLALATIKSDGREIETSYDLQGSASTAIGGWVFKNPANGVSYPIHVGDVFKGTSDFYNTQFGGARGKTTWETRVVGWEDVTVPGGTFRALKIEAKGTAERSDISFTVPVEYEYWYSPKAARAVKMHYRTPYDKFDAVLTDYKLNP